jgi:hypothetical protein
MDLQTLATIVLVALLLLLMSATFALGFFLGRLEARARIAARHFYLTIESREPTDDEIVRVMHRLSKI